MPDSYMLDVWMLISNILDCVLQTVWKPLLVGFEIGPASVELMFATGVLLVLSQSQGYHPSSAETYKRLPVVVDY